MTVTTDFMLSPETCRQFHRDGYLGPFTLCSPEQMAAWRQTIEARVLSSDPTNADNGNRLMSRHMDSQVIRDIVSQASLVDRMRSLLGPDLLCWNTYLWNKEPGGLEIPWHQDIDYWPIEPPVTVSAWIAINEVNLINSCPQIIAKSHKKRYPTVDVEGAAFATMADPNSFNANEAIDMIMQPGEFFIFNERTLHHSNPNNSNKRRLGMSVRFCPPWVMVNDNDGPLRGNHESLLVAGQNEPALNAICGPLS